jgi:hypothetical protein
MSPKINTVKKYSFSSNNDNLSWLNNFSLLLELFNHKKLLQPLHALNHLFIWIICILAKHVLLHKLVAALQDFTFSLSQNVYPIAIFAGHELQEKKQIIGR